MSVAITRTAAAAIVADLPAAVHARPLPGSPLTLVTVCGYSTSTAPVGLLSTADAEHVTCAACRMLTVDEVPPFVDVAGERALEAVAAAGADAWDSDRETGALDPYLVDTWEDDAIFYGGAIELETVRLSTPSYRGHVIRAVAAVPDLRAAWRAAFERGYREACAEHVAAYRARQGA